MRRDHPSLLIGQIEYYEDTGFVKLTPWEKSFLLSIKSRAKQDCLSRKQMEVLERIYKKSLGS